MLFTSPANHISTSFFSFWFHTSKRIYFRLEFPFCLSGKQIPADLRAGIFAPTSGPCVFSPITPHACKTTFVSLIRFLLSPLIRQSHFPNIDYSWNPSAISVSGTCVGSPFSLFRQSDVRITEDNGEADVRSHYTLRSLNCQKIVFELWRFIKFFTTRRRRWN